MTHKLNLKHLCMLWWHCYNARTQSFDVLRISFDEKFLLLLDNTIFNVENLINVFGLLLRHESLAAQKIKAWASFKRMHNASSGVKWFIYLLVLDSHFIIIAHLYPEFFPQRGWNNEVYHLLLRGHLCSETHPILFLVAHAYVVRVYLCDCIIWLEISCAFFSFVNWTKTIHHWIWENRVLRAIDVGLWVIVLIECWVQIRGW